MGNSIGIRSRKSSTELTEQEIQSLLANTSFDLDQIRDWHKGFLVKTAPLS
jgi:hypothetical protein